jgi:hypothetical protein
MEMSAFENRQKRIDLLDHVASKREHKTNLKLFYFFLHNYMFVILSPTCQMDSNQDEEFQEILDEYKILAELSDKYEEIKESNSNDSNSKSQKGVELYRSRGAFGKWPRKAPKPIVDASLILESRTRKKGKKLNSRIQVIQP